MGGVHESCGWTGTGFSLWRGILLQVTGPLEVGRGEDGADRRTQKGHVRGERRQTPTDGRRPVKNPLSPYHPLVCSQLPGESAAPAHIWEDIHIYSRIKSV